MELRATDLLLVERGGVQYHMTADQFAVFVGAVKDVTATTITARDALTDTDVKVGDRVFVSDASGDATVDAGWAVYRVATITPGVTFDKIQEQESMDVTVVANVDLGVTRNAASATITNTAGVDAVIPAVDATNAGLATPTMFQNTHVPAVAGLTAQSNPVVVDGPTQSITFNIAQLLPLPA